MEPAQAKGAPSRAITVLAIIILVVIDFFVFAVLPNLYLILGAVLAEIGLLLLLAGWRRSSPGVRTGFRVAGTLGLLIGAGAALIILFQSSSVKVTVNRPTDPAQARLVRSAEFTPCPPTTECLTDSFLTNRATNASVRNYPNRAIPTPRQTTDITYTAKVLTSYTAKDIPLPYMGGINFNLYLPTYYDAAGTKTTGTACLDRVGTGYSVVTLELEEMNQSTMGGGGMKYFRDVLFDSQGTVRCQAVYPPGVIFG